MTEIGFTFPHTCTIYRPHYGETSYGGETVEGWELVDTGIECFCQNAGNAEIERYLKREMNIDTKIYFKTEPHLREGDLIQINSNSQGASYVDHVFSFQSMDDATSGLGVAWKAMANRYQNPLEPIITGMETSSTSVSSLSSASSLRSSQSTSSSSAGSSFSSSSS